MSHIDSTMIFLKVCGATSFFNKKTDIKKVAAYPILGFEYKSVLIRYKTTNDEDNCKPIIQYF